MSSDQRVDGRGRSAHPPRVVVVRGGGIGVVAGGRCVAVVALGAKPMAW